MDICATDMSARVAWGARLNSLTFNHITIKTTNIQLTYVRHRSACLTWGARKFNETQFDLIMTNKAPFDIWATYGGMCCAGCALKFQ